MFCEVRLQGFSEVAKRGARLLSARKVYPFTAGSRRRGRMLTPNGNGVKVDAGRADPRSGSEDVGTKEGPPFFWRRWRAVRPSSVTLERGIEGGRRGDQSG